MKLNSHQLEIIIKSIQANTGQFFTVISEKRTEPNVLRIYNYKWQNRNALKGGTLPYDKVKKNLLIGYDPNASNKDGTRGGWRAVNVDDIAFVAVRTGFEDKDPYILVNDILSYRHCKNYKEALNVVEKTRRRQKPGILETLLAKQVTEAEAEAAQTT